MVYLHGGGFVEGSGQVKNGFGPEFLMTRNVVLVTVNYRLGPFGKLLPQSENWCIILVLRILFNRRWGYTWKCWFERRASRFEMGQCKYPIIRR